MSRQYEWYTHRGGSRQYIYSWARLDTVANKITLFSDDGSESYTYSSTELDVKLWQPSCAIPVFDTALVHRPIKWFILPGGWAGFDCLLECYQVDDRLHVIRKTLVGITIMTRLLNMLTGQVFEGPDHVYCNLMYCNARGQLPARLSFTHNASNLCQCDTTKLVDIADEFMAHLVSQGLLT